MFFGKTDHNLDDKGRLALPSKFRKLIKGKTFLNIDLSGEYLELLLEKTHNSKQEFLNSFNELDLEAKKIKIFLNAQTHEIKIDSIGRINIPNVVIKSLNFKKEVVVIGNGDRIVIWNKKQYEQKFESNKASVPREIAKIAQKLSQKVYENK